MTILAQQLQAVAAVPHVEHEKTGKGSDSRVFGEENRNAVLAAVVAANRSMSVNEIAEATGLRYENARLCCVRLTGDLLLVREQIGKTVRYALPGEQHAANPA